MPAAFPLALAILAILAQPIETIYVAPMSHCDVGFNGPPSAIAEKAAVAADLAISEAKKDPDYVWCFETFWQLQAWLDRNPDPAAVVDLLRAGRFGLSASYVSVHASLLGAFALERQFRLPTEWARERGLKLDWAVIDDVPGQPIDLPKFLAASGVKYLALGVNQTLTKALPDSISNTPFWWEHEDGARVLVWISADAYTEAYMEYGIDPGTARFFNPKKFAKSDHLAIMRLGVESMMKRYKKRDYPYDAVLALHAFDNWGADASTRLPAAMRLWNEDAEKSGAKPRIKLATPGEFFRHVEEKYGASLPVRRGGFGGQWEGVRTAIPTALARARAEERRLAAMPDPPRADVARLLAFWDHGVGMGCPWPDLLTREEILQHNQEQFAFTKDWPPPDPPAPQGETLKDFHRAGAGPFESNGLCLMKSAFFRSGFSAMPEGAWLLRAEERLPDGTLRLRHRIDRLKLPKEAHVLWAWKLGEKDAAAPVEIKTASGAMKWPDDGLAGYYPGHWIAPERFTIGSTTFEPRGPFYFFRMDGRPGWIFSQALDQALLAEFKGKKKGELAFEEAYPGEATVYEFTIDVSP